MAVYFIRIYNYYFAKMLNLHFYIIYITFLWMKRDDDILRLPRHASSARPRPASAAIPWPAKEAAYAALFI